MNRKIQIDTSNLPVAFGRAEVSKLFPGVISEKTLANLANQGIGPRYFKNGRLCIYRTADFVEWLQARAKTVSTADQTWDE